MRGRKADGLSGVGLCWGGGIEDWITPTAQVLVQVGEGRYEHIPSCQDDARACSWGAEEPSLS